jgi:membrane associated rhomboid family serine protease
LDTSTHVDYLLPRKGLQAQQGVDNLRIFFYNTHADQHGITGPEELVRQWRDEWMQARRWQQMPVLLGYVALLWGIECINALLNHRLNRWGILPRTLTGLVGIPLSPFLHGSFAHLILNTVPLVTLGSFVAFYGTRVFLTVSLWVMLLSGAALWLLGRSAYHVGASSMLFGYFGYLVARGWYERSVTAVLVAFLTLVLYGGIVWGALPMRSYISWEGHLFGLLAGVLVARLTTPQRRDRPVPRLTVR